MSSDNKNPQLTFWTGVDTVTGANFLMEYAGRKILVDCGLLQGSAFAAEENWKDFPYIPQTITDLFVTHAHMDHIGRIPKLVRDGFIGTIYSTEETKEIAEIMLADGLRLLSREAEQAGRPPLYSQDDIVQALGKWKTVAYHEALTLSPSIKVKLLDAGHILGSSMFRFELTSEGSASTGKPTVIVFTGDTGNSPTPLLRDTEEVTDADYLVLDSVYGDRNHEPLTERRERFRDIIRSAIARGGALIIPSFSVERSQIMLYEINTMVENGEIPRVPVFFDSPLALKITEIYRRSTEQFKKEVKEELKTDDVFDFPELHLTAMANDSAKIHHTKNPKIIIAGSGMSSGGRVVSHEKEYLPDPHSTILFVGYQVAGSLGRAVAEGASSVTIDGKKIPVHATIQHLQGYSSHKDSDHLIAFAEKTANRVKEVFVVMGEPRSALFLVQKLRDNLGVKAQVPERGKVYEIPLVR